MFPQRSRSRPGLLRVETRCDGVNVRQRRSNLEGRFSFPPGDRHAPLLKQQRSAIATGAKNRYHSLPTTTKLQQILPTPPLRRSVAGDRPQQRSPHHSLGGSFRVDSRRALLIAGKVTLLSPTLLLSPVAALREASKPRAGRASPTAAREVRFQNVSPPSGQTSFGAWSFVA